MSTIIGVTFVVFVMCTMLTIAWSKHLVKSTYEECSDIAEMWTLDKYGDSHSCQEVDTTACHELGKLADFLRAKAAGKVKTKYPIRNDENTW